MSTPSPYEASLEQRLGLVLRAMQRMADGMGAVEQRLPELASAERLKALSDRVDEYRVRTRSEVGQVTELATTLAQAVNVILRDQQALSESLRSLEIPAAAEGSNADDVQRLTEAVRALRDDLAESHRVLAAETQAAVDVSGLADELAQLRTTLDGRHVVVTEAVAQLRDDVAAVASAVARQADVPAAPPAPGYDDTPVRGALDELREDLRRLHGEVEATAGQLRTDVGARQAELRDEILQTLEERLGAGPSNERSDAALVQGVYDRLGGIEWRLGERLDPWAERLAAIEARLDALHRQPVPVPDRSVADRLAALEVGLSLVAQRDDVRRGVERLLGAVTSAEESVTGEVRAVDARVGAIAEEVRLVRVLRDGLDALADGIDAVRQLAARTATSQQMSEVTRELAGVMAEIDSARSQVLRVEESTSPVAAEVVAVGSEVDDLGRRIDELAEVIGSRLTPGTATDQVTQRLRQVSASARILGNGVLEDLRSRRVRRGP